MFLIYYLIHLNMEVTVRKPLYYVYIIQEIQTEVPGEKNTWWTKVGVAFPHKNKPGLNIILTPGIAVTGKLVLLEPREDSLPPTDDPAS
ncbi:hypothetical protein Senen10_01061 [Salmonella enterica subsp. enterica]